MNAIRVVIITVEATISGSTAYSSERTREFIAVGMDEERMTTFLTIPEMPKRFTNVRDSPNPIASRIAPETMDGPRT